MTFKRVFLSAALLVAAPAALAQETRDPSAAAQGPATATANGAPVAPTPPPSRTRT